ncbi:MAG: hypothetical protein HY286_00890 [Planctomycetes bacterium]|nr:hypothetical protein [Planctomycetota bacterium]
MNRQLLTLAQFGALFLISGAANANSPGGALAAVQGRKPVVETVVVDAPPLLPQQGHGFSLDNLAEPGRRAADTLKRLKDGIAEPVPPGGKRKPGGPQGVLLQTPVWNVPSGATGFNVVLSASETGVVFNGTPYGEQFSLMIPANYNPLSPPPLVVAWHGYGNSQIQPMPYLAAEANNRGWMLMAPLGIADNSFSWLPGQQAVEKSIDWLRANYPYDESRVYGVGFSMGAMCITNFASRHLDPAWTRFAALATCCATLDNVDDYTNSVSIQSLFQFYFGGSPYGGTYNFEYYRTSLLRLAMPMNYPYPPVENITMARAIAHLPVYMTWSTDDNVVPYCPTHNLSLITYLTSLGNAPYQVPQTGLTLKHHWTVLNVVDCFNYLQNYSLVTYPTHYSVLADIDGSFNNVATTGGASGQFRRFDVNIDPGTGIVHVDNTKNVSRATMDLTNYGMASGGNVSVMSSSIDSTGDVLTVMNPYSAKPPSRINIDSNINYIWTYDGAQSTTLNIPVGTHTTDIVYNVFDFQLAVNGTPSIGSTVTIDTTGGADGEVYWTVISNTPGMFPLSLVGDGDPRWLSMDLFTLYPIVQNVLSNGGQDSVAEIVPNDPMLVGSTFYLQNFTAPGSVSGIPFLFGRISNQVDVTIQ